MSVPQPRGRLFRKYIAVLLVLVGGILVASSLVELYFSYRETQDALVALARAKAQAAVPEVCKNDAKRHCSNFRAGDGRVLRCLIRSDNVRKVSKNCNQAITDAGWR